MSEPTPVLPPGSWRIRGNHGIMAWKVEPDIVGDYLLGEYVHIRTPDHLNKVGKIAVSKSDGSYMLRLVGEADTAEAAGGVGGFASAPSPFTASDGASPFAASSAMASAQRVPRHSLTQFASAAR